MLEKRRPRKILTHDKNRVPVVHHGIDGFVVDHRGATPTRVIATFNPSKINFAVALWLKTGLKLSIAGAQPRLGPRKTVVVADAPRAALN